MNCSMCGGFQKIGSGILGKGEWCPRCDGTGKEPEEKESSISKANADLIAAAPTLAAENEKLKARVAELENVLGHLLKTQPLLETDWLYAAQVLRGASQSEVGL